MSLKTKLEKWQIKKIQSHYRKLKRKLRCKSKIKIVFLNCSSAKWSYQSIYEEFEKDNRFEVCILVSCYEMLLNKKYSFLNLPQIIQNNFSFFKKQNMNVEYAFDFKKNKPLDLKQFSPDIIFYDEPQSIAKKQSIDKTKKYAIPLYCSYGSCISNGRNEIHPVYKKLNTYFVDNMFTKEVLTHNGFIDKQVYVAGQPKIDNYLKPLTTENIRWKTNLRHIIYAPHFSFDNQTELKFGTFNRNYKFFYNWAKEHQEFEFVFKPHPSLKREIVKRKLMTLAEMNEYFKMWEDLPNAQVFEEGNYIDMFRTSDLLITDCNSFLYEYLPTTKPVIHLINPDSVGYNEFGRKIIEGYYKAITLNDIEEYLNMLLVYNKDILLEKRINIINEYINLTEYNTAKKVYDFVCKECEL